MALWVSAMDGSEYKNTGNVFEQREALALWVSATDGSEYKNIRNVFEQREALALMGERHGW
jgi:hypothetical protein